MRKASVGRHNAIGLLRSSCACLLCCPEDAPGREPLILKMRLAEDADERTVSPNVPSQP